MNQLVTEEEFGANIKNGAQFWRVFLCCSFCILLAVFLFGLLCVCWKFGAVKNGQVSNVFGLTTLEVTTSINSPNIQNGEKVLIQKDSIDNITLGQYVVYRLSRENFISSQNIGFVDSIEHSNSTTILIIKTLGNLDNEGLNINQEQLVGKVMRVSASTYNFISFINSTSVLFVFVLIPGFLLLGICIFAGIYFYQKTSREELQQDNLEKAEDIVRLYQESLVKKQVQQTTTNNTKEIIKQKQINQNKWQQNYAITHNKQKTVQQMLAQFLTENATKDEGQEVRKDLLGKMKNQRKRDG